MYLCLGSFVDQMLKHLDVTNHKGIGAGGGGMGRSRPRALSAPVSPLLPNSARVGVALKDDPDYGKFFKMLKSGVPRMAVEMKMEQAGLDASLLDMDPNSSKI